MVGFVKPEGSRYVAVGHRGAPREFPPNTMAGYRRAFDLGCPMVETDVRRSRDGVLVLAHDGHVTARSGRLYAVENTDSQTLHAIDLGAGEGVPTLAELAEWAVESGASIMADMKADGDGIEEEVARLLAPLPPNRKVVPGAGDAARRRFRAADPALRLSYSLDHQDRSEARFRSIVDQREALCIDAVTFGWPLLARERIARLHDADLFVFAWTVDDAAIMARLAGWGVDGVISNEAETAVRLARR